MTAVADLRAEALFCSDLQPSDEPADSLVRATVLAVVFRLREDGCAERVAAEFGEHPECSGRRMRWALELTRNAFAFLPA